MSALPTRTDISGAPSKATAQAAFVAVYDYLKGLFGSDGVAGTARSALAIDGATVLTSIAANALTIALKTAAGADASAAVPLPIPFRSVTLSSGTKNVRQAIAALSLVVPSTATLGAANGVDQWLYLYALDNAGAVELAISAVNYGANFIGSTTAIAAASNSRSIIYSTTARASVPMRLLATLRSNQVTAGTWAAVPVEVTYPDAVVQQASPAFSATQSVAQTIETATVLKISFQTKEFDTANAFDAVTNYRFQPATAGYYQVNFSVGYFGTFSTIGAFLYKNGSRIKDGGNPASGVSTSGSALVFLNGTTDFLEVYGYQASGAPQSTQNAPNQTFFQAFFARSA